MNIESVLSVYPEKIYEPTCASFQYGANFLLRDYCKFPAQLPFTPVRWLHGWMPPSRQVDPLIYTSMETEIPRRVLVARTDEVEYLKKQGVSNAHAVGLPFCYVRPKRVERRPNTLLVMPAHSLDYTTHNWRFDDYVDAIDGIRHRFSDVFVCVHPSCLKNGYWVNHFSARGYHVIPGTNSKNAYALDRLDALLRSFEYVTTNQCGSHVAYAASVGCKVSIFGEYAGCNAEDCKDDVFYIVNEGLLEKTLEVDCEKNYRKEFPFLFCDPHAAPDLTEWGRFQIGCNCRPSRRELRRLLGWTLLGAFREAAKRIRKAFRDCVKSS